MKTSKRVILIVCGGRSFNDAAALWRKLDKIAAEFRVGTVWHGGASGADSLGGSWAAARGHKISVFPADWDRYGKKAGMVRNSLMVSVAMATAKKYDCHVLCVAAPGDHGTRHMVNQCEAAGIRVDRLDADDLGAWTRNAAVAEGLDRVIRQNRQREASVAVDPNKIDTEFVETHARNMEAWRAEMKRRRQAKRQCEED